MKLGCITKHWADRCVSRCFLSLAGVRLIEFSPNEKYMITYSAQDPVHARDSAQVTLTVFDVRSGRKLRVFEGPAEEFAIGANAGAPSHFTTTHVTVLLPIVH